MNDLTLILLLAAVAWLAWRIFATKSKPPAQQNEPPPPPKEDPQARYMRNTLEFAKSQHRELSAMQRKQAAWQQEHGRMKAEGLDQLSGTEFEEFLAGLFRAHGYAVELTPQTGDYGADLILEKDGQRIAVQAKRYVGTVGVAAVQEALSGQAYYSCNAAWVVTTGAFTTNALELAAKSSVRMIGRSDIGILMTQQTEQAQSGNHAR